MPYQLQPGESLPEGLKRIAEEQCNAAIRSLRPEADTHQAVYQARKTIKKIRSILRLLAPCLGVIYDVENRRLRDIARGFSDLRDTDASLELLAKLTAEYKRKGMLSLQRQALNGRQTALQQQIDWPSRLQEATDILSGTRKHIDDWPLHELSTAFVEEQVRRTHKQCGRLLDRARQTRTAEDFHELRKSVKRELNQLRLFNTSDPRIADLKQLSTLLGDHHNLHVLSATVDQTSGRFRQMTRRKQRQLELQILSLAPKIYAAHAPGPEARLAVVNTPHIQLSLSSAHE